jgi:hypothetical protein
MKNHEPSLYIDVPIQTNMTDTAIINIYDEQCNEIMKKHSIKQINDLIYWKEIWRIIALSFTIFKYICYVSTPILSLSSTQDIFNNKSNLLSYLSGVVASLGLGFEKLEKISRSIVLNKEETLKKYLREFKINYDLTISDLKSNDSPKSK